MKKLNFTVDAKYVCMTEGVIYFVALDNRSYMATEDKLIEYPWVKWLRSPAEATEAVDKVCSDEDIALLEKNADCIQDSVVDLVYPIDKIMVNPKSYLGAKVHENFLVLLNFNLDSAVALPVYRYCQGGYVYDNAGKLRLREYLWQEGQKYYQYGIKNGYTFLNEISAEEWQKRCARWKKVAEVTKGNSLKEGTFSMYLEEVLVLPGTINVSKSSRFYYSLIA